jgi:hypothetical protein
MERLLNFGCGHRSNNRATFVAFDNGDIAANDSIQTSTAIWITEIRMRNGCPT